MAAVRVHRLAALIAALAISFALAAPVALASLVLPPSQAGVAVYDLAGIWDAATESTAQGIADTIRARTQAQLAIVSYPSDDCDVSTETAGADALLIMNTWGVGRAGVNDGLVVLFDMNCGSVAHGQIYLYAGSGFVDQYLNPD